MSHTIKSTGTSHQVARIERRDELVQFLLKMHPVFFASSCALLFLLLRHWITRIRGKIMVNWPVAGMLPTIIANKHRLHDHLASILRESDGQTFFFRGPWFCGMDLLLTCNPENANHVFNIHFSNYPKGGAFLEIFDVLGEGIFNVDGDSWVAQRKMAHAQIGDRRFRSSVGECTRGKVAKALLPLLNHVAESDSVIDLSDIFMRLTCDTTCALVLGVDPGCLSSEFPTVPFAKAIERMEQVLLFRHTVPMVWWKLLRWLRVGEERKMAEAVEVVDRFIAQCIQERRRKIDEGGRSIEGDDIDLLTPYMGRSAADAGEDSNSTQFDDEFLRDTLLTFLGAGKDTTGAALVWLFWLVANNPEVERKILEELRQLRPSSGAKERASLNDGMTVFDAEEIDPLVYLHATLCETLRLYPSVPFNHKEARSADVLPSGHQVRPGMTIIFSMYAMARMERVWGKDCLEFRPERWITEKGTLRHEPSYKFVAFHSGPRSCLGKGMAFTQIKVVAAALIYNFSIQVVEGRRVRPTLSIVIQTEGGLLVRLKRRARPVDIGCRSI